MGLSGWGPSYRCAAIGRDAVALSESKLGPDNPVTLTNRIVLGRTYLGSGRPIDAAKLHEKTVQRGESRRDLSILITLYCRNELALTYEFLGRWGEAETLRRETLARRRAAIPGTLAVADDLAWFGRNQLNRKRLSDAENLLREALAIREKEESDDWQRFNIMSLLGGACSAKGATSRPSP